MSFSGDVKRELEHANMGARHCMIAELAGYVTFCGRLETCEDGRVELTFRSDNRCVASRIQALIRRIMRISPRCCVRRGRHMAENKQFEVCVQDKENILKLLQTVKQPEWIERRDEAFANWADLVADPRLCQQDCCRRALIRSCFMAAGSMSNPEVSYHFEIVCRNRNQALQVQHLINAYDLDGKIVLRKKYDVVYVKESEQIADLLNIIGAHNKLLELESMRVVKDVRNNINRKVNCETANINKTVQAATGQVEDIEYIRDTIGLGALPENLQETARLRLEYSNESLQELCGYFEKPIGKSGLNHRLRKLKEIAQNIREERNEN